MTGEDSVYIPLTANACVTNPGPPRVGKLGIPTPSALRKEGDTTQIQKPMTLTLWSNVYP